VDDEFDPVQEFRDDALQYFKHDARWSVATEKKFGGRVGRMRRRLGAFAFPGTTCSAIDHAIIARFLSIAIGSADGEPEAQQFPDRSRTRRHTVLESEIVEY
jgi:hypothetical protein